MVDLIAESVIEDARVLIQGLSFNDLPLNDYLCSQEPIDFLVKYAETIYAHNDRFRRKVNSNANQGNAGRDYLINFMAHWLSSELGRISRDNPDVRRVLERSGFSWYGNWRQSPEWRKGREEAQKRS